MQLHGRSSGKARARDALPHRTPRAIQNRAERIGASKRRLARPWSSAEDAILTRVYPEHGIHEALLRLNGRSKIAVKHRAALLGLTKRVPGSRAQAPATAARVERKAWTPRQDSILRDHFPESGARGVQQRLPCFSLGAIYQRATAIGVQSERRPVQWSPQEDDAIRALYPKHGAKGVAQKVGNRSLSAIKVRASKLGIRRKGISR